MPAPAASHLVKPYRSAADLPGEVWETFRAYPQSANIIYPHAKKARQMASHATRHAGNNLWIVCTTCQRNSSKSSVEFILSCTEGPIGPYPIFIFTTIPASQLRSDFVTSRVGSLVRLLQESVAPERVYSVFALEAVARCFATLWTARTGIHLDRDPEYYAAKFTYCTRSSLRRRQPTILPDVAYNLRLAGEADVPEAAKLCYGFAAASEPFILSMEDAVHEATLLVRSGQLWVHEIVAPGQRPEIASLVAVTRTSETVSAITKVFTNPRWRQRGCAERLTRHVCMRLLETKESVVLYVAHNNPAAAKVYHRVGFAGLAPDTAPTEGVDAWLELGFDRDCVDLGHW